MCCYEQIVNQIIQKIIKEMHQTATTGTQREWMRASILDADILEDVKVISLQVASRETKAELLEGELAGALAIALNVAYPGYRLEVTVKQPLNLEAMSTPAWENSNSI